VLPSSYTSRSCSGRSPRIGRAVQDLAEPNDLAKPAEVLDLAHVVGARRASIIPRRSTYAELPRRLSASELAQNDGLGLSSSQWSRIRGCSSRGGVADIRVTAGWEAL
jgi:hypothetical protein